MKKIDRDFYLNKYADVALSGMDPQIHFNRFEQFEGRKAYQDDNGLISYNLDELFPNVSKKIHPADEMFLFAKNNPNTIAPEALYLSNGQLIFEDIVKTLDHVGFHFIQAKNILDFAAGYGRVTRFWCQHFPANNIWAADVQHAAIDFQVENFGVNGTYSYFDPKQVHFTHQFDLISVVSLFSHLPISRFREWLRFLVANLSPQGVLIFSVLNTNLLDKDAQITVADGFLFVPDSESSILPVKEYGTTYK